MRFFSGGRRAIWVEVATGAALLFGLTHYWHAHSAPRGRVNLGDAAIPTATVSPGNVADTIRISGTIGALRSATVLAPRIQGNRSGVNRGGSGGVLNNAGVMSGGMDFNLVLLRLAKPGARVKAGEIVAEFDPQNQVQRVDDYKDAVVQLDGSIRKMAANLASNKEAHDQQVRAAKAAWDKSIEDVKQASVVDAIDAELLRVAVQENEATYKQLVYESSLVDDQQISQIRLSQLNHDQADLELKRAEGNVTKMVIRAPMDGVVVMASIVRNGELGQVREGDQVNPGQPFMYIIDPTAMVLDASLNQVDAERLRLGAKALVHVDS